MNQGNQTVFINLEYFFRLLIDWLRRVRLDEIIAWIIRVLHALEPFIEFLCFVLFCAAVYYYFERKKVDHHEERQLAKMIKEASAVKTTAPKNAKWERVLDHINSNNQNDWKAAIIEADIMLDELLTILNYQGDSIGAKLKAVEPSDFDTLQSAWEAHKVRNQIAHEGSEFVLSERDAKRTIAFYKAVFEEFEFI
ncbi:MAG: hypothetical protein RLZZ347_478 [Candidatus Parcubacteria bacterium]|jgi:hypothetical protein